jgi:hypothetical protein
MAQPLLKLRASGPTELRVGIKKEINEMLWTIIAVLLVLWLIGLVAHIGGGLIHLLLVVALVVFVINLITGRQTV